MKNRRKYIITTSLLLAFIFMGIGYFSFFKKYSADALPASEAPIVKWSGGGTDISCGGATGSGNWWSCANNWSGNIVPTSVDHVIFDSTSTKDSVIDSLFAGTVHSVTIDYDYSGIITQQRDFAVTNDFTQNGSTFNSSPSFAFTVGGSFFVADNQISNGSVNVIRGDSNGNLYVGGTFLNVSNLPIKYLAKWDGKKWSTVGDALDGPVGAMAIDSNNNLYIGGTFKNVGNMAVNGIAKWNGTAWSDLDGGVTEGSGSSAIPGEVKVLEVDNLNRIYIGGTFEHAGSVQYANHFARWNGVIWERFGHGFGGTNYDGGDGNTYLNGYVSNIIIKDSPIPGATDKDIYFGGDFTNICGNDACASGNATGNYLAKFNGATLTLSTYGNGTMTAPVRTMTFDASNNLVVVSTSTGIVQTSDGKAKNMGYFDGSNWIGYSPFNGSIKKLATIDSNVYTGGLYNFPQYNVTNFTAAIPNYYGSNVALGYGVDGEVYDIQNIGGSIYVAGAFKSSCSGVSCSSTTQSSAVVKYDPNNNDKAKRLASPFRKALFSRYTGAGTIANPYLMNDVYGLQAATSFDTSHFALSGDIDASSTANWNSGSKFLPISSELKPFVGSLNGNGHTITGLKIANFFQDAGLFGVLAKGSSVKDMTISNANLASAIFVKNAGILAGNNNGIISGITVSGDISIFSSSANPGHNVGGIVGFSTNKDYGIDDISKTSISNSSGNVSIIGSNISSVGGVLGRQEKIPIKLNGYPYYTVGSTIVVSLSNLTSSGSINLSNTFGNIGGLIGLQDYENATIFNSSSTSDISITIDDGDFLSSYASENVGGLIGHSFGSVDSSSSIGSISINSSVPLLDINDVGGLIGKSDTPDSNRTIISGSSSSSNVIINQSSGSVKAVGGLVGESAVGKILSNSSSGNVTINSSGGVKFVGGLAGYGHDSDIAACYSTGVIRITNQGASNQLASGSFGGLVGLADHLNINDSHSSGNLVINSDSSCGLVGGVAGLVGIFSGEKNDEIANSYSEGVSSSNCTKTGLLFGWSTTDKPGDINNSATIDDKDFTILLFNWGDTPRTTYADINSDGKVDDLDFTILLFWWGK